jgi:flagellar motor switch protein FliG
MVAIALRYLPRVRAAEVLAELSQESRIEVVMRFVKSDDPLPEAVETLGRALWEKAGASGNLEEGPRTENAAGRARALVEMLNNADLAVEEAVLEGLVARDPELGEQVRESMFIFDDLPRLDPRALQLVLRSIEASDLTLALKGAPDEVKKAVSENLSENAAAALKEDLEAMGPVRRRDIYAAQQKVVTAVRTMAEEGHISIRATVQTDEFVA